MAASEWPQVPRLMRLETGAPANALPQRAAETGPRGFGVRAEINHKTHECKRPRGASDKGQQSLAGGSGPVLCDENINARKESRYLKTIRKGEGFSPFSVFSIDFQRQGKVQCLL